MTPLPPTIAKAWLPVALSRDLRKGPLARRIAGTPIVLFRGKDGVAGFVDRCPHRNYPLSEGRVREGVLECPYHGWRFDTAGACVAVPGLPAGEQAPAARAAQIIGVVEKAGAIFVCLSPEAGVAPGLPPLFDDGAHDSFWWSEDPWRARAIDGVDNILDPFHTGFIHDGLIRSKAKRQEVEMTLSVWEDGLEAGYIQASGDRAWMPRMLEGPRARSRGRFYAPVAVQARWEGPKQMTLAVTAFFTPESETRFRPFARFTTPKGRAPAFIKKALIKAFLLPVVAQDRTALEKQLETMETFGGPRFVQGPLDRLTAKVTALHNGERLAPETLGPFKVML